MVSSPSQSIHEMLNLFQRRPVSGKQKNRQWLAAVPAWLIIGAALILIPVFIFMAKDSIDRHEKQTTRLLVEKGAAIIRSFEAGARTGAAMRWGIFHLQKLLMETAEQSDIDYIIVTDSHGLIVADSDPLRIGMLYETGLNLEGTAASRQLSWRRVKNSEGSDTFEVYRGFLPTGGPRPGFSDHFHPVPPDQTTPPPGGLVIFAGLNMAPVEEALRQEIRRTVWNASLFLIIVLTGIFSLLLAQGYRAARSSLSRVRAFSDSLAQNIPVGLIATDTLGIVTVCNRAAETIFALQAGEALGKPVSGLLPPECGDLFRTADDSPSPTGKETICAINEGEPMTLETVSATLYENDGTLIGNIVIFRNMTEIKRLEEEVTRSRRLASLGGLAAGIAHELRNPLSSIKGFATYFREKSADDPADREAAEVMIAEVDRMNRTITQLIDFARPLTMNVAKVSLALVMRHALALIVGEAEKQGVAVTSEIPEGKWEIPIDADRITQVLLNLFLNAIKAMESGGHLLVSLFAQDDGNLRITVADTGIGIPAADLPRVFDPYFTTRPAGTGLGLAISHKIIEAHRGEIYLESEHGKGTTAVVILPGNNQETGSGKS
jgi:two-component system sensor histidine kinase HydH